MNFVSLMCIIGLAGFTIATEDNYVCEHETFHIKCAVGQMISVSSAVYGRQKSNVCTNGPNPQTNNCAAVNSLKLVQDQCEGRETCDIQASNGVFQDPCVGTFKYLEIVYSCKDYVCEHDTLHLECAVGQTISVSSALYGRQKSNVCTNGPNPQTNNCAAVNSLKLVQDQCEGHETCDIQASNGVFGDPCVGTFKYLEIEYSCEDADTPECDAACPQVWTSYNGACYLYNGKKVNWATAKRECASLGADLVSHVVRDGDEHRFLGEYIAMASGGKGKNKLITAWIDLNDQDQEGNFVWHDGEAHEGVVDQKKQKKKRDCVVIKKGAFLHEKCASKRAFLCKQHLIQI
ncbi:L-rhamnose-binding lectin SML-like isoform X1 [Amphiura filiformis]|uniref:L-rhamnose-binding lectin SML-like isoform X1 n=1 Tax=Amphiura filiformis TaxID=82378 RepID=UPI003B20E2FC